MKSVATVLTDTFTYIFVDRVQTCLMRDLLIIDWRDIPWSIRDGLGSEGHSVLCYVLPVVITSYCERRKYLQSLSIFIYKSDPESKECVSHLTVITLKKCSH